MKKILGLSVISLVLLASCKKEEKKDDDGSGSGSDITVVKTQNGLGTMVTATWCPPCGSWGHDAFNAALNGEDGINPDKSALIALHSSRSDNMYTEYSEQLMSSFSITGYPNFQSNLVNYETGTSAWKRAVSAVYADAPLLAIGAKSSQTGDVITIDMKMDVYQAIYNDINVGVWIVKKSIVDEQKVGSSTVSNFTHHNVMYDIANGTNVWGEKLADSASSGDALTHTVSYTLPSGVSRDDIEIVLVAMEMGSNKPLQFLNSLQL